VIPARPGSIVVAATCAASCLSGACGARTVQQPEVPGQALVVLLPDTDSDHVGRAVVTNAHGTVELSEARQATLVTARRAPEPVRALSEGEVRDLFGETLAALPPPPRHYTLFFEFDSEELTRESRALTPEIVRVVKERRVADVLIVGHTDTTGSRATNFELGLRRAGAVRTLLRDGGLDLASLSVVSHGETELLVPTADGVFEARNRRVEITVR
jgi:OOP family OmpA-OmpF porin